MSRRTFIKSDIKITPPLKEEHKNYLIAFNLTRHTKRKEALLINSIDVIRTKANLPLGKDGEFFVGVNKAHEEDMYIEEYNTIVGAQPSLWCGWLPNDTGTELLWDETKDFYEYYTYIEWVDYIIKKFMIPWGYNLNGNFFWHEGDINGEVKIINNKIKE